MALLTSLVVLGGGGLVVVADVGRDRQLVLLGLGQESYADRGLGSSSSSSTGSLSKGV